MSENAALTGNERTFDGTITSETDTKGLITATNDLFREVSGYSDDELLGAQHNIVRHPDMPKSVFRLLWKTIADGKKISAFVVNRAKNGDYYWVLAHVTPLVDDSGNITGYHSDREVPKKASLDAVIPLYKQLLDEEGKHANAKEGMEASSKMLMGVLSDKGVTYDELIQSLS